tara:strand:- start:259 stop:441 length:183 start_codon:yes stop_codon:yes gene_type:complete
MKGHMEKKGAGSTTWVYNSEKPGCHFCGVLPSKAVPGVEHNGVAMCGKCIDEAREIAGRE